MDLGMSVGIRRYPDDTRSLPELYDECLEICAYAEQLGWDHVWLPEHHMSDLWLSSPMTVLSAIAARTSRIRIGTYILLLALHDPFRIAEDIATVDIISHGRLDIGIGAAPEREETDIWGIAKPETYERTYEAMRVIERLFTEKEVTHHGKYYHYDSVTMSPLPVQKPGPPFWIAAQGPQSAARAARRGYYSAAGAGRAHDEYVAAWIQSGRDEAGIRIVSVPLVGYIAETKEKAWDAVEHGLWTQLKFYRDRGLSSGGSVPMPKLPPVGELRNFPGAGFGGQALMLGTPDDILRDVEARYANRHITELELYVGNYARNTAERKQQMDLFAREIMPAIRRLK